MASNMDGSTLEESVDPGSTDSSSMLPFRLPHKRSLQPMGSAGSVVLDEHEAPPTDSATAESRKLPSSQYKGVVPQPNGRWGAQIYEKHHRVWLGTFDGQPEAAAVYDVAAHRFRGRDAVTNFTQIYDEAELDFIGSHSKAEIVDMLRKHTYRDELRQSKRSCGAHKKRTAADIGIGRVDREQLFEKTVTPSDVGKLNRLVIPKQYAEKYFPLKAGSLLLSFEDECGKVWRFRYSYWNSSQSYVLTKGWSRFVKEKGLKAGEAVIFQRSIGPERQLYIERKTGEKAAMAMAAVQGIRLFGVNIFKVPVIETKRLPAVDLVKKQCIRDL